MTSFEDGKLVGRVAVYSRVSTEDQCKEPESSLDNQLHRCGQYLRSLGADEALVKSVRVYREEGRSGKDLDRPELLRLLRDMRQGHIDLLVFTELSRVSRSLRDFLQLSDFLAHHGVEWISLKEQFNTTSPQRVIIVL